MNAAQLREKAVTLLTPRWQAPTPEEVARAAVWARLAVSAAISETNADAETVAAVREYAETSDHDSIRTRENILRITGPTPPENRTH